MQNELTVYRQQVNDLKLESDSLGSKVGAAKKAYFAAKLKQRSLAASTRGGEGDAMELMEGSAYGDEYDGTQMDGAHSYHLSDFNEGNTADFGDFMQPPEPPDSADAL